MVSDRRGDLDASPTENHGLFLEDTRFLSRWILTVGGTIDIALLYFGKYPCM